MKKQILNKIPHILLYSRLLVAILIIVFSFIKISPTIIVVLSIYAIVSDIFDGVIARHLKISTPEMRQLDTKIDTVFWFSCLFYLCINQSQFIKTHSVQIFILVLFEIFVMVLGKIKFQQRISYHTILSKFWALCLLWFFIDIILNDKCKVSFLISFWYGVFAQLEIIAIAIILKTNQTDVLSVLHAIKFRKGISISKSRFFK
jgi:CDP-diacylglycerol--glycerol-3-phosphate 3-phosphatidyltransferase